MKTVAAALAVLLAVGVLAVSVIVQLEADYAIQELGGPGPARALILYHPSRDAGFSQDLSTALAGGLRASGFAVARATLTAETPARPDGYGLVAVVSNTYYWAPDLPTLHYLRRARLDGIPAVGLIGGAGATGRSERLLREALRNAGATVLETRSFWLWRPNDEERLDEPNRVVALDLARRLGARAAETTLRPPR